MEQPIPHLRAAAATRRETIELKEHGRAFAAGVVADLIDPGFGHRFSGRVGTIRMRVTFRREG